MLNSIARSTFDPKTGEYTFKGKLATEVPLDVANDKAFSTIAATNGPRDGTAVGVGSSNYILVDGSLLSFTYFRVNFFCTLA